MRKIFINICILFLCSGCRKNFLDRQPTSFSNKADAYSSIQSIKSALTGCYSGLKDYRYYGRNFYLFTEVYTDNAKLSSTNLNNFSSFYNYSVLSNTNELDQFWKLGYSIIARTNNVIDAIQNGKNFSSTDKQQILGEALSIRALVYFDLVRVFAQPYGIKSGVDSANGSGGHIGIPIILKPSNQDTLLTPRRQNVDSVYKVILNDLLRADKLLIPPSQNSDPYTFSSYSVEALLSRVYLTMGVYSQVINYSYNLIARNFYKLLDNSHYISSWSISKTDESILSISMLLNDNNGSNSIGYMLSKSGYGDIVASQDLYNLYKETDVRKNLYKKGKDIFVYKYPGRAEGFGIDNIPIIRYSEIYFNYIEAILKYTNYSQTAQNFARSYLDTLMKRVDNNVTPNKLEGADLMDYILNERRKEFAFEGQRYFDLKRLQSSIIRTDCNALTCSVSFPSYLFAMPIPISEINSNKNMKQNPGY